MSYLRNIIAHHDALTFHGMLSSSQLSQRYCPNSSYATLLSNVTALQSTISTTPSVDLTPYCKIETFNALLPSVNAQRDALGFNDMSTSGKYSSNYCLTTTFKTLQSNVTMLQSNILAMNATISTTPSVDLTPYCKIDTFNALLPSVNAQRDALSFHDMLSSARYSSNYCLTTTFNTLKSDVLAMRDTIIQPPSQPIVTVTSNTGYGWSIGWTSNAPSYLVEKTFLGQVTLAYVTSCSYTVMSETQSATTIVVRVAAIAATDVKGGWSASLSFNSIPSLVPVRYSQHLASTAFLDNNRFLIVPDASGNGRSLTQRDWTKQPTIIPTLNNATGAIRTGRNPERYLMDVRGSRVMPASSSYTKMFLFIHQAQTDIVSNNAYYGSELVSPRHAIIMYSPRCIVMNTNMDNVSLNAFIDAGKYYLIFSTFTLAVNGTTGVLDWWSGSKNVGATASNNPIANETATFLGGGFSLPDYGNTCDFIEMATWNTVLSASAIAQEANRVAAFYNIKLE
jgi:hypothetical protein